MAIFLQSQPLLTLVGLNMKSCNSKSISPGLSRVLPSEVEVLESIYLDELQVVKGNGRYVFNWRWAGVPLVIRGFHAVSVSLDSKIFLSYGQTLPLITPKERAWSSLLLPTSLSSHQAPAQSHPRSPLHPPAGHHHGKSTSPCTLPLQRTRIPSMSASLWCFRFQHRWGLYGSNGRKGEALG